MPTESFRHSATALAPVEEVWRELDNPSTWESIAGIDRVVDPVVGDDGRLKGFSFDTEVAGKAYRGRATPNEREELHRMGWNIENSEITGTVVVTLSPSGPRTDLVVDLTVTSKGILSRMFFSVVANAIVNGLPRSVDQFANRF